MTSSKRSSTGGPEKLNSERTGFRSTFTKAINQIALAGLASCDERTSRQDLFQDEIVIDKKATASNPLTVWQHLTGAPTRGAEALEIPLECHLWGSHRFEFSVDQENLPPPAPQEGSTGPNLAAAGVQGVQLVARAREKGTGTPIQLQCTWKRKFGNVTLPVTHVGDTYAVTADDVAATILVEATATGHEGAAFGEIGPFTLDSSLKNQLERILQADGTEVPIHIESIQNDRHRTGMDTTLQDSHVDVTNTAQSIHAGLSIEGEGILILSSKDVTVKKKTSGGRMVREALGRFSGDFPEISIRGHRGFTLRLDQSTILKGVCSTRSNRELLVMTIRVFRGRQAIGLSALIDLVSRQSAMDIGHSEAKSTIETDATGIAPPSDLSNGLLDLTIFVQRMSAMLSHTSNRLMSESLRVKHCQTERDDLEEELQATIKAYQAMVTNLQEQLQCTDDIGASEDHSKPSQRNSKVFPSKGNEHCTLCPDKDNKLREAAMMNEQYRSEVDAIREELKSMKDRYTQVLRAGEEDRRHRSIGDMKSREELNMNRSQIFDYRRKNDEQGAKIKRLEKEKNELQQNFLYTKEKLDQLVEANKMLEFDKTRMIETTMGDDAAVAGLTYRVSELEAENAKLRDRIRKLASAA